MSACTCGYNVCSYCRREIAREFPASKKFQPDGDPPQTLAEQDAEDAREDARAARRLAMAEVDHD